jgi:hypothetical protein
LFYSNTDACIIPDEEHKEQGYKPVGNCRSKEDTDGDNTGGTWSRPGTGLMNFYTFIPEGLESLD